LLFINTSSNCFSSLVEFVALKTSERAKNKIYFFISKNYSLATVNFWEKQDYLLYTHLGILSLFINKKSILLFSSIFVRMKKFDF
jgi:hypothetical protein